MAAPVIPSDLPSNPRLTAARNRLRLAHPTGGDVTPASEAFLDRDRAMGRDNSGIVHLA
jgi:hypothetical protein